MPKDEVEKVIGELFVQTEAAVANLTLDIHGELIEETPVDTGWAQNNWLLAIAKAASGPVGSPDNVDTNIKNAGVSKVLGWKIADGPLYITNNVPYILKLDAGSSKQAPKGFIEKTVMNEVAKANRGTL